jgi:hypothetical protein
MAKNSAVQYEVVAVDDEDGVQWRRWRRLQERSTASKTKARWWRVLAFINYVQHLATTGREGSSVGVGVSVGSVGGGGGGGGGDGAGGWGGRRW